MQVHHEQRQSRSIAAVPCSNQYRNVPAACPPRPPLVALFQCLFSKKKQPAGAVGLCGHACRSHLPLMTRGAAGTTCLRRRVAVRVRQAGSSGFPDPQQTGGHVVVVGKRNQSLVARTHARTGAAVGCCCAVAARLPLLIMTARWGL